MTPSFPVLPLTDAHRILGGRVWLECDTTGWAVPAFRGGERVEFRRPDGAAGWAVVDAEEAWVRARRPGRLAVVLRPGPGVEAFAGVVEVRLCIAAVPRAEPSVAAPVAPEPTPAGPPPPAAGGPVPRFPLAAFLAGVVWAAVGTAIVLWAVLFFLSIPSFLRGKNSGDFLCVSLFGLVFGWAGWLTLRGCLRRHHRDRNPRSRLTDPLAAGVGSAVVGALGVGVMVLAGGDFASPVGVGSLALVAAGGLAVRGRGRYRAWVDAPRGRASAGRGPGYRTADRLALTPGEPGPSPWTEGLNVRMPAERPFWARVAAAAALYPLGVVLGLGVVGLWSAWYRVRDREPGPHTAERMTVAFIAVLVATHGVARRVVGRRAREVARHDRRPPVLLLRAFADDGNRLGETDGAIGSWRRPITLEDVLAAELARVGPLVTIGRPGELLPPSGAARLWLDHADWQAGVTALLGRCRYVVMVMGRVGGEQGLAWELEQVTAGGHAGKLVLVVPAVGEAEAEARWEAYRARLPGLPAYVPFACLARPTAGGGWVVVCGAGWGRGPDDYRGRVAVR